MPYFTARMHRSSSVFFPCLLIVAIVNGSCLASQLRFIENLQQSLQSALVPGAWTL